MEKTVVRNPIISGSNPDPNVLKVENTYYIAVSTFEWLPGIRVYQSEDLVNWQYKTDILTTQVNLQGNPRNCSIWAPQISFKEGKFYVLYTNVRSTRRPFKDCHNYYMTADSICGPWSDPVYLNSSGFDPSFFHDVDGKTWLLNEIWDYRLKTYNKSAGIVLQELDIVGKKLVGPVHKIFSGTALAKTEAPMLYKHEDYYYLFTAEGGTDKNHGVTICRSKTISGPYELSPYNSLITARDKPENPLQCTGHASLIENEFHQWFIVYLCTRPLEGKYAVLGRETAIQEVYWTADGWLRLKNKSSKPEGLVEIQTKNKAKQNMDSTFFDDFSHGLKTEWNSWKNLPTDGWCRLTEEGLEIVSGESLQSPFEPHILAIRQKDICFTAEVSMYFSPKHYNELAGLVYYLDEENYVYSFLTYDESLGTVLRIAQSTSGIFELLADVVAVDKSIKLKFVSSGIKGQYYYQKDDTWQIFGPQIAMEYSAESFTGSYIGISVQNMNTIAGSVGQFYYFKYKPEK
ncbi:glycoside hydrolase family 43 protein [Enterococcus nangangensis]|uniref:glycoside hydrolase family 43 protein n=1 Tax=Enterococcus nangangensis TaxID=2559926 RepID=UPI0010F5224D|nr:glycoside hydrolase family 43 protein [Enterococcus nangangensis]